MVQDFQGYGDSVVRIVPPQKAALIFFACHPHRSNTIVEGLDGRGQISFLPVNHIGQYSGTRLFDGNSELLAFKISCGAPWALSIRPLGNATVWQGPVASGTSDDVLYIPGGVQHFTTVVLDAGAYDNVAVWAFSQVDRNLIFNEVGPCRGLESVLPVGSDLVAVEHPGPWQLRLN